MLYDTKSFKKYKLVSIIYMGKNFPLKDESNPVFCEVNFYNNPKFPIVTDDVIKAANPEWNNVLFITAMLNEGLELSENIRLHAKYRSGIISGDQIIGSTEIPVVEVDSYNHQDYIEKDVFKKAKWYTLEHPTLNSKCYVLARFMLVKLIKQDSEEISALEDKNLIPKNKEFYIFLFFIGVRSLPDSVMGGFVEVSYDIDRFSEGIKERNDLFENNEGEIDIFNFNNLDVSVYLN